MNYIFLADGFETVEALAVVDMLRRAKLPISTVSVNTTNSDTVTTAHNIEMKCDEIFNCTDFSDADMLILPGGMPGTPNLEANPQLMGLIKDHADAGKNVAAICAAPRILGKLGILEGKRACCYPGFENELKGAKVSKKAVEMDGNCITSRGMGTALLFGAAIVEKLSDKQTADTILNQIQWNTSED